MNIGNRIKLIRTALGISQKEFGERIGISANYLSEVESGKSKPSIPVLLAIEYRFGVSAEWLNNGNGTRYIKDDLKLTHEESEIIKALRGNEELKRFIHTLIKEFKDQEAVVKNLAEILGISFDSAYTLTLIAENLIKRDIHKKIPPRKAEQL